MHSLKGLIFDMDGVLVDTEGLHIIAWKELFGERNIMFGGSMYLDYAGVADSNFIAELKEKGFIPPLADEQELIMAKTEKIIGIAQTAGITPFNGVKEVLDVFSKKFRLALASNSEKDFVTAVLNSARLNSFFRCIITRNDVAKPKPEPDIYLETARAMGLLPEECLVFEDSEVGVDAAKRAGMLCAAVTTTSPAEKLKGADYIYDRLCMNVVADILPMGQVCRRASGKRGQVKGKPDFSSNPTGGQNG